MIMMMNREGGQSGGDNCVTNLTPRLCELNYKQKSKRCKRDDGRQCRFMGIPERPTGANDQLYEYWRREDNQAGPHEEGCRLVIQNEQFKAAKFAKRPFPASCVKCRGNPFCACPVVDDAEEGEQD
jgi:hypothetical protein